MNATLHRLHVLAQCGIEIPNKKPDFNFFEHQVNQMRTSSIWRGHGWPNIAKYLSESYHILVGIPVWDLYDQYVEKHRIRLKEEDHAEIATQKN